MADHCRLQITPASISLVSKPMDAETGDRMRRVLFPRAAAEAVFLDLTDRAVHFKNWLIDLFPKSPSPSSTETQDHAESGSIDSKLDTSRLPGVDKPPPQSGKIGLGSVAEASSADQPPTNSHRSWILSSLQKLPLLRLTPESWATLRKRYLAKRQSLRRTPPRGVFYFTGPLSLEGPDGWCRYHIIAEYDPVRPGWTKVACRLTDGSRLLNPRGGR
jgi:hypothetical protein